LGVRKRDASLLHGPVQALWTSDGQHFWYASKDTAGSCWQLVDVQARRKRPMFNAAALAQALGQALGKDVAVGALPVAALSGYSVGRGSLKNTLVLSDSAV
jgi:hypothetical protein